MIEGLFRNEGVLGSWVGLQFRVGYRVYVNLPRHI